MLFLSIPNRFVCSLSFESNEYFLIVKVEKRRGGGELAAFPVAGECELSEI